MKIIQLCYTLSSGGAEKFIVDFSNELCKQGHEVMICMLRDESEPKFVFNKQFISKDVEFHSMGFSNGFSLNKVYQLTKYIKQLKPDIVHCHLNVIPYIFYLSLTNNRIKFYHTLHNVAEATIGSPIQKPINHFFYKYEFIKPIAISQICKNSYEKFYKLKNAPYINNGRSEIRPTIQYDNVKKEINNYKNNKDTLVFTHIARYNQQKNQELLIEVFNFLCQKNINFILLIIGSGFNVPKAQVLKNKACQKIYFLGEKSNIGDYLLCSDAFCLTSIYEGLPISLLEALSCGVTPICTPVGGIPDVIIDGKYGYLSKSITSKAYIKAIENFMEHPIPRDILQSYFKGTFSITECVKKYLEVFNSTKNTHHDK